MGIVCLMLLTQGELLLSQDGRSEVLNGLPPLKCKGLTPQVTF